LHGRKPADRRVRVERPHSPYFRYTGPGQMVAKAAAHTPKTGLGRTWARIRGVAIGRPLASEEEAGERLSKKKALAIFSSDAISSSAYATQEIIRVLAVAGATALAFSVGVSIAIAVLLAVVATSYRQVCRAYPNGGGAYAVAKENLNPLLGLVAAAALLIDYVMTVAVSTASAIGQIASVLPNLAPVKIEIAVVVIFLITVANLRGLRESGNIFAIPTYAFLGLALLMVGLGLLNIVTGAAHPIETPNAEVFHGGAELSIFLLLKAFAGGSVALTGVEAIANGVPAFKSPEARNAANTMTAMAVLLGVLFIGITVVAHAYQVEPTVGDIPTTVSLVAGSVFGNGSVLFVLFQASTALILFLAANTSYNAFPRLGAILAVDGYMPRQFSYRGDRLAYSWGIILLSAVAAFLLWLFNGEVTALIPLYSVGVFVCFTLSQIGMVKHWLKVKESGWQWRLGLNAFGAVLTAVVLVVVVSVKFVDGAYLVVILIPVLVALMLFIHRQYDASRRELQVRQDLIFRTPHREERAVVPIPGINRAVIQAVNVARSVAGDVRAVFITESPEDGVAVRERWERQVPGVPLVVVESPYRALTGPLEAYLDVLDAAWPPDKQAPITFVVLPEYVARNWWERILYNQSVKRLRSSLLGRPHTVVVNVPYRREDPTLFERAHAGGGNGTPDGNTPDGDTPASEPAGDAGAA
jgi:amino acid transporter